MASEDDQKTVTPVPTAMINLSLTKTASNLAPSVGSSLTFTVTLANAAGLSAATGVQVSDPLPAGYTLVSATPSQGSYVSATGLWTVGGIASGSSTTLSIVATVNAVGPYANTAEVTAADQQDINSTPNNHVASEDDQQTVTPVPQVMILHGYVYFDANNDAQKVGADEIGLAGITVTLSGMLGDGKTDVCSVIGSANCVATTDSSGAYTFSVPPGIYVLTKSQSDVNSLYMTTAGQPLYADGKETTGVAGGTVDNSGFGSNPGYNRITGINVTSGSSDLGGYLFGVVPHVPDSTSLLPPVISGYVYQDLNHDRTRPITGSAPSLVQDWMITLTATTSGGGTETICVVQTDATGFYHFDNLSCGTSYPQWKNGLPYSGQPTTAGGFYLSFAVSFSNPGGIGFNTAPQSGGAAGTPVADSNVAKITGIVLRPGDDVVEQDLPLDPSGVVYDANTRAPILGAIVTLSQGATPVPASCLVSGQNPEITGSNGFYQFLLIQGAGCPSGTAVFNLGVAPPSTGYAPGPSTMIPPTAGPHTPSKGGTDPVQVQAGPPPVGQSTTYYLVLNLTLGGSVATSSSNVVNNHIPLDPVSPGMILMSKTTPLLNVSKGDLVPYIVTATNLPSNGLPLANIDVVDLIPPGFAYKKGSANLGGVGSEPRITGRTLTWPGLTFGVGEKKTWKMLLVTGAGVSDGLYTNLAWASNHLTGGVDSNVAAATVRIVPDPTFDCSEIIGKVFDDQNANGYEDEGEPGLPNVRVVTVNGLLVTTDKEGRFHVACADIPQDLRGSNFMMKLDERTLPSGYRVTTENPRVIRTTRGKMVKLNFGAAIHRVVRLELSDAAFRGGRAEPSAALARALDKLPTTLRVKPSVLRLAYRTGRSGASLAKDRLRAVRERIEALWKAQGCCYTLVFEEEIFERAPTGSAK